MSLSDVMGEQGLSIYAEVGLVIFLVVFLSVVVWTMCKPRSEMDLDAQIPLDDSRVVTGDDGVRSLEVAMRIGESMAENRARIGILPPDAIQAMGGER